MSRRRDYSPDEISEVRNRYPLEGSTQLAEDLGRTQIAITHTAWRIGAKYREVQGQRDYSPDEIAAILARYPIEGPNQLAIDLGRTPKGIQRRAQRMELSCKRRDCRIPYTRAEVMAIRKRYPAEGAAQLAADLGRTKAGIEQAAWRLGVKFRAYKRNEARWHDHHATTPRKSPCTNSAWMDDEHAQWMQQWQAKRAQRGHNAQAD
jgi:hypothetical protein